MDDLRTDRCPSTDDVDGLGPRQGWNWNRSSGFMVTNHFTNPILIRLLEGRFGGRLGRSLAVVRYTGRTTGEQRRLVTQYRRAGGTVTIDVVVPKRKQWWRNFTTPRPIELTLAGSTYVGSARASVDDHGAVTVTVDLGSQHIP